MTNTNLIFTVLFYCIYAHKINSEKLPFSRIKVSNDEIYFMLNSEKWHKLLSIDSIGSDAIIQFAKDHYGHKFCDYYIECYKYNIIVNFNTIYSKMQNKQMPERVGLEYEYDNFVQNGIDVESTEEKYKINQLKIEDNINQSKLNENFADRLIFKGLNKLKKAFSGFGQAFNKNDQPDLPVNNQRIDDQPNNLRKEIVEIKKEMNDIVKQKEDVEKNILNDIEKINSSITTEKTIIENIWKREIFAGIIGGILVFGIFTCYYLFNGLVVQSSNKEKKYIN